MNRVKQSPGNIYCNVEGSWQRNSLTENQTSPMFLVADPWLMPHLIFWYFWGNFSAAGEGLLTRPWLTRFWTGKWALGQGACTPAVTHWSQYQGSTAPVTKNASTVASLDYGPVFIATSPSPTLHDFVPPRFFSDLCGASCKGREAGGEAGPCVPETEDIHEEGQTEKSFSKELLNVCPSAGSVWTTNAKWTIYLKYSIHQKYLI